MEFYVGQKVVAISSHPSGLFKSGDMFIVLNTRDACCCKNIDIGIKRSLFQDIIICGNCGSRELDKGSEAWFMSKRFAPLQEEPGELFVEDFIEETVEI